MIKENAEIVPFLLADDRRIRRAVYGIRPEEPLTDAARRHGIETARRYGVELNAPGWIEAVPDIWINTHYMTVAEVEREARLTASRERRSKKA